MSMSKPSTYDQMDYDTSAPDAVPANSDVRPGSMYTKSPNRADFLERPPSYGTSLDTSPIVDAITYQTALLKDIRLELMKKNPSVLTQVHLDIAGSNDSTSIVNDLKPHRVIFLLGGKQVSVYRVAIWSNIGNTGIVRASFTSMSALRDGFSVTTTPTFFDGMPVNEMYIIGDANSNPFTVNAPSGLAANGGLFIYGWTVPEFEAKVGDFR